MARELLRSVDGRQLPNLGEVAVYWPNVDCANVFDTTGFEFTDKPDNGTYPELIEHDAEATALELLELLHQQLGFLNVLTATIPLSEEPTHRRIKLQHGDLRTAISKATGSQA